LLVSPCSRIGLKPGKEQDQVMIFSRNYPRSRAGSMLAAAAFATVLCAAAPTAATPTYDGLWSVVIVTEKGDCDRAYRYPIRISNGALANAGDTNFNISGKVVGNGAITVTVSHGDKSATGSGRLSRTDGAGSWRGGACAGSWSAERRG
jgi:spore coat protein U-like protein